MWWNKKKEVKSSLSPIEEMIISDLDKRSKRPIPKFKVVTKEITHNSYETKTIIYMKDGRKYISISRRDHAMRVVERPSCLVTGEYCRLPNEKNIQVKLRSLEEYFGTIYLLEYYHNGIFTSFEHRGNTISVQSIDIDRIVQRPAKIYKTDTFMVDSLEKIK